MQVCPYPALSILLAEDNAINRKVMLLMLKRLGYRADVVINGAEALGALKSRHYDVVLMDVGMPELDGLEATRAIRTLSSAEDQPHIIAVTAYALKGDRERCLAAGMDDYISKPVEIGALQSALQKASISEMKDN